jgi:hypothetical protein
MAVAWAACLTACVRAVISLHLKGDQGAACAPHPSSNTVHADGQFNNTQQQCALPDQTARASILLALLNNECMRR